MKNKIKSKKYDLALKIASSEKPNNEEAFKLLNEAYLKKDYRAAYALGNWYIHGKYVKKDIHKGIEYIRIAAANKIPSALYDLAYAYEIGEVVKKNSKKAFEFYTKAVLEGDKQSIYEVGRCLYYGIGCKIDKNIGMIWIDKAKKLGIK